MSIVITTPTGNVGGQTARLLLDAGQNMTLIARDKQKVAALESRGARVMEGSHSDVDLLITATRGASALFFATPPNLTTDDIVGHYRQFGTAAAKAIDTNKIPFVVHLSSVGAELSSGTGPILGAHFNEAILNEVAVNIIHLRPAYFMENTLMQLPSIAASGQLFTPLKGTTAFPMIATRDIAARAAALLSERDFIGQQILELIGPEDMSYNRVSDVLSNVLNKPLTHTTVPGSALVDAIVQMGGSRHIGEAMAELNAAVENGYVHFSGDRNGVNRTPTTYLTFATEVFKPVFEAQMQQV